MKQHLRLFWVLAIVHRQKGVAWKMVCLLLSADAMSLATCKQMGTGHPVGKSLQKSEYCFFWTNIAPRFGSTCTISGFPKFLGSNTGCPVLRGVVFSVKNADSLKVPRLKLPSQLHAALLRCSAEDKGVKYRTSGVRKLAGAGRGTYSPAQGGYSPCEPMQTFYHGMGTKGTFSCPF